MCMQSIVERGRGDAPLETRRTNGGDSPTRSARKNRLVFPSLLKWSISFPNYRAKTVPYPLAVSPARTLYNLGTAGRRRIVNTNLLDVSTTGAASNVIIIRNSFVRLPPSGPITVYGNNVGTRITDARANNATFLNVTKIIRRLVDRLLS